MWQLSGFTNIFPSFKLSFAERIRRKIGGDKEMSTIPRLSIAVVIG